MTLLSYHAEVGYKHRDRGRRHKRQEVRGFRTGVPTCRKAAHSLARVSDESGQASVEWIGLVLLVALVLGAAPAAGLRVDGRSFGGFLAHRLACAVEAGGCDDGDAGLARAYGQRQAELVRRHAPSIAYEPGERELPVDFRRCRSTRCSDAALDRDADVHRTRTGERATVYTRVVRRGGRVYIQYWLYYPDSNTALAGSNRAWERSVLLPAMRRLFAGDGRYPGFHRDDWEGYQVRLDPDGTVWARATAHGGYQGCKQRICHNRWVSWTGWTRVSRGSHAGHVPLGLRWRAPGHEREPPRLTPRYPGRDMRERSSTGEALRLVPLEPLRGKERYRPLAKGIKPPWKKRSYRHPETDSS